MTARRSGFRVLRRVVFSLVLLALPLAAVAAAALLAVR